MAEFSLYSNPMPNFNDPANAAGLVAFLKQQEPNLLNNLSYVDRIKYENPTAYAKIAQLASFTANENYGGKVQDYQAQIFTPLSADVLKKANAEFKTTPVVERYVGIDENGQPAYQRTGGQVIPPKDVQPTYDFESGSENYGQLNGYTKDLGTVNGIPLTATYDARGNLTGYQGDQNTRSFINGSNSVAGNWDASGNPAPKQYSSSGGGFLGGFVNDIMSDPILGTAANIAAGYFGGPLGTAALGLAQGKSPEEIAKSAALSYVAGEAFKGLSADPNAVGGVTGPDNIDVGGGFNPAAGATAAELEAARAALDGLVSTPIPDANIVETVLPPLADSVPVSAPTLDKIIADLGAPPTTITTPTADVYGPELLGEAGGNTFPLELEPEGLGPVPLGDAPTVTDITNTITGNADRAALNSNAGYGDTLTSSQITAVDAAVASGMTVAEAINYVRAGLLVNAITGDPLGLSGGSGGGGTTGTTGFAQVPIPVEWKSPTYAAPAAPIDLNSLFTDMNLLGGTQWQGLVDQKPNVSFNDIFAAGKQQTPMGSPVDINQIVSAILGQNTASQKPA